MANVIGSFTDTLAARAEAIIRAPPRRLPRFAPPVRRSRPPPPTPRRPKPPGEPRSPIGAASSRRLRNPRFQEARRSRCRRLDRLSTAADSRHRVAPDVAVPSSTPLDQLNRWRDDLAGGANLGPVNLKAIIPAVSAQRAGDVAGDVLGFLPPSGLAINVDAGFAKGGGSLSFSDVPHWRLEGAFGVNLGVLSVAALGILERPGGALSLVMLLSARFTPGIQLGFGFQISGVGGLIGINRRADTDAMRARLSSGAATDALFADNPAANAPAILETLGSIFVRRRARSSSGRRCSFRGSRSASSISCTSTSACSSSCPVPRAS